MVFEIYQRGLFAVTISSYSAILKKPPANNEKQSLDPASGRAEEISNCMPIPIIKWAPGRRVVTNCGTDIVKNGSPPPTFFNIGYFEGYGLSRAYGMVDIRTLSTSNYIHIHFTFATSSLTRLRWIWGRQLTSSTTLRKWLVSRRL